MSLLQSLEDFDEISAGSFIDKDDLDIFAENNVNINVKMLTIFM